MTMMSSQLEHDADLRLLSLPMDVLQDRDGWRFLASKDTHFNSNILLTARLAPLPMHAYN